MSLTFQIVVVNTYTGWFFNKVLNCAKIIQVKYLRKVPCIVHCTMHWKVPNFCPPSAISFRPKCLWRNKMHGKKFIDGKYGWNALIFTNFTYVKPTSKKLFNLFSRIFRDIKLKKSYKTWFHYFFRENNFK